MRRLTMRHLPRTARALAAALLLVGLLVVVAIAARGSHPSGHGRIAQRHVPDQVNNDLLTILLVLYLVGAVGLVVAFILYKSAWQPVESHWLRDLLTSLIVFSLVAAVGYRLFHSRALHRRAEQAAQQQLKSGGRQARPRLPPHLRRATSGGAHFDTTLALGLLGLLVVGGAIYYVRRRTAPLAPLPPGESGVKNALAAAVSDAIEDLENEPDARRAVIAAYARMERALGRHGHARHPAETPFEYLGRILGELDVRPPAVEELTQLFERAKFSTHPIDDVMKQRAISALLSVREDLAEPAVAA
jgi:membrane protease YdiL (CAAX protease family)